MDASTDSIRVVGESDLLELCRTARSTWKHWCTQGLVQPSDDGLYHERDVIEAVVVALLVDAVDLRRAKGAWSDAGKATLDRCQGLSLREPATLFLVVDLHTWEMGLADGAEELAAAVAESLTTPRGFVVMEAARVVVQARRAFWVRAAPAVELQKDGRRRRSPSEVVRSPKRR